MEVIIKARYERRERDETMASLVRAALPDVDVVNASNVQELQRHVSRKCTQGTPYLPICISNFFH